jgi:superfamily II DNA or RNA helicase
VPTELRDYQFEIIGKYHAEVSAGRRRILLVAPTGSGKTVVAGAVVADVEQRGQRILFLAHRRELIRQTSRKLHDLGIDHGILADGFPARLHEPVQIAMIQTLHARAVRSTKMLLPEADIVIVDEAHHARAKTYAKLLEHYPQAIVLGPTATPCRGDGRGLGNTFDTMIECPPVQALIDGGYLVPTIVYAPTTPNLKGVRVRQRRLR